MAMHADITPLPLRPRKAPFDHTDWLFELKYDGFRALARIENGRCQLISRNGHPFSTFSELEKRIATALPGHNAVLDGEIVCVDAQGRLQFEDLLFHRGEPCFFSFDLLIRDVVDLRTSALVDRKQELRRLLAGVKTGPIMYVEHVEETGIALFERVCELDLEGIVAKRRIAPYGRAREESTWLKITNPGYSQKQGREGLFDRQRHKEPVAGWHSCDLACAELDAYAAA